LLKLKNKWIQPGPNKKNQILTLAIIEDGRKKQTRLTKLYKLKTTLNLTKTTTLIANLTDPNDKFIIITLHTATLA